MWALYVIIFMTHPNFVVLGGVDYEVYTSLSSCEIVASEIMTKSKDIAAMCVQHEEDEDAQ